MRADKREALFGRFFEEASKLYADALQNRRDDVDLRSIGIYALTNRMRLMIGSANCRERGYGGCNHRRHVSRAERNLGGDAVELG